MFMQKKKGIKIYVYLLLKGLLACGVLAAAQLVFYLFNLRIFHISGLSEVAGILLGNIWFGAATVARSWHPIS